MSSWNGRFLRRFRAKSVAFVAFVVLIVVRLQRRPQSTQSSEAAGDIAYYYENESTWNITERILRQTDDTVNQSRITQVPYPRRKEMGACPPLLGKVTIFVAYANYSMETNYKVAQQSLECYLRGTNYSILMIDLDNDARVQEKCSANVQLFFKKHCAASAYLVETDWMLVLDADTGVVNPNHCIEEWIDDSVDIIFYERFFTWEIASGNYLVRNTSFSQKFLREWGDWEFIQPPYWSGSDNGVLQIHILQTIFPNATQDVKKCEGIWYRSINYETYLPYVFCVRQALGATRIWPQKIRIYRRAHAWVRDGFLTNDKWSDFDFMIHGWKHQNVNVNGWKSPFNRIIDPSLCGPHLKGWTWSNTSHLDVSEIRKMLARFEVQAARALPKEAQEALNHIKSDVRSCYPYCENNTMAASAINHQLSLSLVLSILYFVSST